MGAGACPSKAGNVCRHPPVTSGGRDVLVSRGAANHRFYARHRCACCCPPPFGRRLCCAAREPTKKRTGETLTGGVGQALVFGHIKVLAVDRRRCVVCFLVSRACQEATGDAFASMPVVKLGRFDSFFGGRDHVKHRKLICLGQSRTSVGGAQMADVVMLAVLVFSSRPRRAVSVHFSSVPSLRLRRRLCR